MKIFEFQRMTALLRYCLILTFCCGVFVTAFLPYVLRNWLGWYFYENDAYYNVCLLTLQPCGVFALTILYQLISILKTVHQNPFVAKNARCLRNMALACFAITVCFGLLLTNHFTVLTAVVAYIFLVAGFSCLVFSKLFKKAVEYKAENDLTI